VVKRFRITGVALRIIITKSFRRFCRKVEIADAALVDAVEEIERGLIDADLGGGLLKKRIARAGGGKSGGFRVVLAFRSGDRTVFIYGFAKSERDNISSGERVDLKAAARVYLELTGQEITEALNAGALEEIL
jgi:hypothetical protein